MDLEFPMPTPSTPTLVAVPTPQVDAPVPPAAPAPAPNASTGSAPTPQHPLVVPEIGWTSRNKFMDADEDAHYHTLLTGVLASYYPEFAATVHYLCSKHKHPLEDTYWKTEVIITQLETMWTTQTKWSPSMRARLGVLPPMRAWRMQPKLHTFTTMVVVLWPCKRIGTDSFPTMIQMAGHGMSWHLLLLILL